MEFPRESDLGKYCPDLVVFFFSCGFWFLPAALMKISKYIGNHVFMAVKFRKPDK